MIISRTPLRIPLGGGSTDLPSYYSKFGGFIFGVAVNLYMHVGLRQTISDSVRLVGRTIEEVPTIQALSHPIAKAVLQRISPQGGLEVVSLSDVPEGTGMGSSGAFTVGLLGAVCGFQQLNVLPRFLAQEACGVLMDELRLPEGKQDPYLTALGGFQAFHIASDGGITLEKFSLSKETVAAFEANTLLFYTGAQRSSHDILREQEQKTVAKDQQILESKHRIKEIGHLIYYAFRQGDLNTFGRLIDEHWRVKKNVSGKISSERFDEIYERAKRAGALGGKLMGAGGGGFFLFYCEGDAHESVREAMREAGLREIPFRVDFEGTKIIADHFIHRGGI